jgi:hypothetical protein
VATSRAPIRPEEEQCVDPGAAKLNEVHWKKHYVLLFRIFFKNILKGQKLGLGHVFQKYPKSIVIYTAFCLGIQNILKVKKWV